MRGISDGQEKIFVTPKCRAVTVDLFVCISSKYGEMKGGIIIIIIIIITCMLIDVALSGQRNVIKKEAEKILKYKTLQ